MFTRGVLILALAVPVVGCSSTSDRYAFWRDDNVPANTAHKPNLGDVPPAPNTQDTINEMEQMRVRLEQDRQDAYVAANSTTNPYNVAQPNANAYAPTNVLNDQMHNTVIDQSYPSMIEAPVAMPMPAPQPQTWQSGDTVYRYGSTSGQQQQNYVYGQSAVHIRSQSAYQDVDFGQPIMPQSPTPNYTSDDPSISINWGALNDGGNGQSAPNFALAGGTGQPLIYYAHGSSRLSKNDRQELRRIADQINSSSNNALLIGHASQQTGLRNVMTSRKVNLNMSAKRSLSVADELVRMGVSPEKLRTAAMGDSLAGPNDTQARRVDILFD